MNVCWHKNVKKSEASATWTLLKCVRDEVLSQMNLKTEFKNKKSCKKLLGGLFFRQRLFIKLEGRRRLWGRWPRGVWGAVQHVHTKTSYSSILVQGQNIIAVFFNMSNRQATRLGFFISTFIFTNGKTVKTNLQNETSKNHLLRLFVSGDWGGIPNP